jgi:2-desacetyl-2-hydroxyethyl bacteriochlorophyllide A dehydrogenase
MPNDARAFWVTAPGRGEIRSEPLRQPGDDEVLVKALYSGISRGTEALVFSGRVPPSEWDRMRAPFQEGQFPAPVKYGYSMVGEVEHGPADLAGRAVFVLHPHQTRFVVPARDVHVLSDETDPPRAVLAANLETALNGVWDGGPHLGDRIAVIGAGTVGCLAAWLVSRMPGCEVELIDINPRRGEVARALGVKFAAPADAVRNVDLVIHASGAPEGLELALQLAGMEAKIVELSWYGDRTVPLPLGAAFHAQRLTIASSQVGRIAPPQRPRWENGRASCRQRM